MTGAITWEQLGFFIVLLGGLAALWWRVETRISSGAREAMQKADRAQEELAAFQLEVTRGYVPHGDLKDVETRMLDRLDGLVKELHGLRQDVQNAIVEFAKAGGGRNSRTRK